MPRRDYKVKGKNTAGHKDVLVTIATKHPLVGFTWPIPPSECGTVDTYHGFEVSKKGEAKNLIIFHAFGDMYKHIKQSEEDGPSTKCVTLDGLL